MNGNPHDLVERLRLAREHYDVGNDRLGALMALYELILFARSSMAAEVAETDVNRLLHPVKQIAYAMGDLALGAEPPLLAVEPRVVGRRPLATAERLVRVQVSLALEAMTVAMPLDRAARRVAKHVGRLSRNHHGIRAATVKKWRRELMEGDHDDPIVWAFRNGQDRQMGLAVADSDRAARKHLEAAFPAGRRK
jgi:hypothetical protein